MENDFIEVNEKVGKTIILGGWGQEIRKVIAYSENLTIIGLMQQIINITETLPERFN
jgi:hypothetical protein